MTDTARLPPITLDELRGLPPPLYAVDRDYSKLTDSQFAAMGIEALARIVEDPDQEATIIIKAAQALLPYVRSKAPEQVEVRSHSTIDVRTLSLTDLERLVAMEAAKIVGDGGSLAEKISAQGVGENNGSLIDGVNPSATSATSQAIHSRLP